MNQHRYKIKWKTEKPETKESGYTKEELNDDSFGTDAFVYISLTYPEDGSFSMDIKAIDGRPGKLTQLSDNELFKVWALLAGRLSDSSELSQSKMGFCKEVFNIITKGVTG